ncbi:MAG TPA: hypothetical protein VF526_09170, partial [Solirubrobacteraceae bacterium]
AAVAWRTRRWATPAGWAGLLGVVCVSWLMPWYVVWALPFAALSRSRTLRYATVVMTAWLVLVWSGLGTILAQQHGIDLGRTAVGRANHRYMDSLLSNHPGAHHRRLRVSKRHRPARRAASRRGPSSRLTRVANGTPTSRQPRRTGIR